MEAADKKVMQGQWGDKRHHVYTEGGQSDLFGLKFKLDFWKVQKSEKFSELGLEVSELGLKSKKSVSGLLNKVQKSESPKAKKSLAQKFKKSKSQVQVQVQKNELELVAAAWHL